MHVGLVLPGYVADRGLLRHPAPQACPHAAGSSRRRRRWPGRSWRPDRAASARSYVSRPYWLRAAAASPAAAADAPRARRRPRLGRGTPLHVGRPLEDAEAGVEARPARERRRGRGASAASAPARPRRAGARTSGSSAPDASTRSLDGRVAVGQRRARAGGAGRRARRRGFRPAARSVSRSVTSTSSG